MNKQKYLKAMHQVYQIIYAQYEDKNYYSPDELMGIVNISLSAFPAVFNIDQSVYKAVMPEIIHKIKDFIKEDMSIDRMLMGLSIFVLRSAGIVTRFFPLRLLLWSLCGPVQIAPKRIKNG